MLCRRGMDSDAWSRRMDNGSVDEGAAAQGVQGLSMEEGYGEAHEVQGLSLLSEGQGRYLLGSLPHGQVEQEGCVRRSWVFVAG